MPGELIVRVFLYGLILVVPHGGETPNDPTDDTLIALLVDQGDHVPMLRYCERINGEVCSKKTGTIVPLKGKAVSFEFVPAPPDPESQEARGGQGPGGNRPPNAEARPFHCDGHRPSASSVVLCNSRQDHPRGYPRSRKEGSDFGWVASLRDVLGRDVKLRCKDETCDKVTAAAVFNQGTVSVCQYPKVRRKCVDPRGCMETGNCRDNVVPLVKFVGSNIAPRAIAESVVVELRNDDAAAFLIHLKNHEGSPLKPAWRKCDVKDADGERTVSCIEFVISNLPEGREVKCEDDVDKNLDMVEAMHWRYYYGLIENPPQSGPYPRPVAGSGARNQGDVAQVCPYFPPREKDATEIWIQQMRPQYLDDRPICPIGTP